MVASWTFRNINVNLTINVKFCPSICNLCPQFPLVEKPHHTPLFSCSHTRGDDQKIDERISFYSRACLLQNAEIALVLCSREFAVGRTDCLWNWKAVWPFGDGEKKRKKKTRKTWSSVWDACVFFIVLFISEKMSGC